MIRTHLYTFLAQRHLLLNLGFLLVLIGCFQSCTEGSARPSAPDVETVEPAGDYLPKSSLTIQTVTPGPATTNASITGRVIPTRQSNLASEVQGVVRRGAIPFKAGAKFSSGDVLLRVDNEEFAYQLKARKAAFLKALTAILSDLKSDYPTSYPQWVDYVQRFTPERPIEALPEPQSDQEKFFLATYQISSQFYEIKSMEKRLAKYQIVAPYDGLVVQTMTDLGSMVNPGQALGMINSRGQYEIEAAAAPSVARTLKTGQRVTFHDTRSEASWMAQLARKGDLIDPNTQNVPLYFSLRGEGVMPGLYVEANVVKAAMEGVVTLPASALNRDQTVLILKNGAIASKPVQALVYQADSVIVTGLAAGDQVILNDFQTPVIGTIVR